MTSTCYVSLTGGSWFVNSIHSQSFGGSWFANSIHSQSMEGALQD